MKVVLMATPDFAIPTIEALVSSRHELLCVVTQPDRVTGKRVTAPAAKTAAIAHGIPVYQYARVSTEGVETLRALGADIMVTCSFGQLLSDEVLSIAPHGVINVHASLLPKYRGAAPIQAAIMAGEQVTGVTIMQTVAALDAGDILLQRELPIRPTITAGELFDELSVMGASVLLEALDGIEQGLIEPRPQGDTPTPVSRAFRKESGILSFDKTYSELDCFVRAMTPWPSAYTFLQGKLLKILSVAPSDVAPQTDYVVGTVVSADKNGLFVQIRGTVVEILRLQYADSKPMTARDFLLGHHIDRGTILGE